MWTWAGELFGYRDGDDLFADHGKQVGKFYGDEIYDAEGKYLGELMNGHHLVVRSLSFRRRQLGFEPKQRPDLSGFVRHQGYARSPGPELNAGFQDFPLPDHFR